VGVYRSNDCVLRTQFFGDRWEVVIERKQQPALRFFLSEDGLRSLMLGEAATGSTVAVRRDATVVEIQSATSGSTIAELPWRSFLSLI
jgi:hypothetical protein